jgi:hypothetical protein
MPVALHLYALLAAALALPSAAGAPTLVVDLTSPPPPIATLLAAQVCIGLLNRAGTLTYSLMRPEDAAWLAILEPGPSPPPGQLPLAALLARCTAAPGAAAAGYIRYSFAAQQVVVPNLLTLAGVLGAVPLEDGSPYIGRLPLLFDALAAWGANATALQATQYVYETHVASTTGMAKMNPGLDVHGHPFDPPLTLLPDLSLADYIVSARLFNFFLAQGCLPGTADHALMERMVQANPWPRPLAVLGYDDTYPLAGGDTFEAETNCVAEHSLGQVATTGVNNLAYFSQRSPPLAQPLLQPPPLQPPQPFNASLSYVALVVGDGDNIAMVKGARFQWFQQRVQACARNASAPEPRCYPLLWTLSPALQRLAPDVARWFFAGAAATGADYFALPPSGHLYAYPASMAPADAADFVAATEADAALYNASATVEWEWLGTWGAAIANFTPRYAQRGTVSAVFAVNVPYMVPIVEFAPGEDFKALGAPVPRTALFRPNEWRGDSGAAQPALHPFLRNASQVAQGLLAAPRGSVGAIYLTSDGGGCVRMLDELAAALAGSHVRVVDAVTLSRVALESRRGQGGAQNSM